MSTFIVTGATGNLGRAVVEKLTREKQQVVAVSHQPDVMYRDNSLVDVMPADAADENQVQALVDSAIKKHDAIAGLVVTVGGFAAGDLEATGIDKLQDMIRFNFYTAYAFARPLLTHMKGQGGRMVFIGTRPAICAAEGKSMVAYALSKSLLFRLAECINADAKSTGVKAAVLVPGTIDTESNRQNMPDADFSKWVKAGELADMVWTLVSDKYPSLREPVIKMYGKG